jgi:GT2 family glycosyltransferase
MNRGFGAGVNFGIAACLHRFVLVLNPDTYVIDSSIEKAIEVMKARAEVGLVGLELTYPNGERQYSARRFYSMLDIVGRRTPLGKLDLLHERMARHLMMEAWNPGVPFDADWVMGAGFIVRRALYEELGGMDEMYFLFMEDVDLCARIWQAGYRVACVPGARLVHEHQRASAQGPLTSAARHHLHSLLRFSKKFRVPLAWPPGLHRLQR